MTSLISSLTGQFSKAVVLSTFLPVTVFVLAALSLLWPVLPVDVSLVRWAAGLDSEWKIAAISLVIVLLTALLFTLNGLVIRFYEGYPWCDSYVGRWRSGLHRRRLVSRQLEWKGLRVLLRAPEAKAMPAYKEAVDDWNQIGRELNSRYPDDPDAVLPTTLGNVIRSFESYPYRQYRMRAITLWPRLAACMDKDYAEQIGDVKSSFDFTLNGSLLSGLLAVLILVVHLLFPAGLATSRIWLPAAVEILLLLAVSYGFYLATISRASAWGMTVKGAFDLFRWKLLESLGYSFRPETLEEERALWNRISGRLIFSDLADLALEPAVYVKTEASPAATSVQAMPTNLQLEMARGARSTPRPSGDVLTVTIRICNRDHKAATDVTIVDTVAEGWLYEWDSASSSLGAVQVSGTNPYTFRINDLAASEEETLTYRILPMNRGTPHS